MRVQSETEDRRDELPENLRRFLTLEQSHLYKPEAYRMATADGQFDSRYLPEKCATFRLPCFWVQRKYLHSYGVEEDFATEFRIANGVRPTARVLFPIHPAELGHYADFLSNVQADDATAEGVRLLATPTSSTRTLLAWPEGQANKACFVKLSLHSRFFGDRRIHRRKVASSVGLSRLVLQSGSTLPQAIRYFPETFGIVPRLMPDSGIIFRPMVDEMMDGRVVLAPLFALMGGSDRRPPLLLVMTKMERRTAREIIEELMLAKFASIWVQLVFEFGLVLEAHAQDLLLALSPDLVPLGSLYYRDFEGLAVDWALRRARGLTEPVWTPNDFEWFPTYETWGHPSFQLASVKMRTSLFDYLSLVLSELESALLEWQARGVMAGERISEGELTLLFSRYLRKEIQDKFGMKESEEYDIHHHLHRFVKFLMQVRREVMTGGSRNTTGGSGESL